MTVCEFCRHYTPVGECGVGLNTTQDDELPRLQTGNREVLCRPKRLRKRKSDRTKCRRSLVFSATELKKIKAMADYGSETRGRRG